MKQESLREPLVQQRARAEQVKPLVLRERLA
jgi:hypothetical protein